MMEHPDEKRKTINKKKEARTKEISKMISEGGLGAEKYYDIHKATSRDDKHDKKINNP